MPRGTVGIDLNARVSGLLADMSIAQTSKEKSKAYARAAAVVLGLERPIDTWVTAHGSLDKLPGIGPSSTRVVMEWLQQGASPTVDQAVRESGRAADVDRARTLRRHFLSRAEVLRVLADRSLPRLPRYLGDLQMHSEWSDGAMTLEGLAEACVSRGYAYAAVTDHSHGLQIARGMSMADAARQHRAIDAVNQITGRAFRLLKGVEANISADGTLDLSSAEAGAFDVVLAAPHTNLRLERDQTGRMLRAVESPHVAILAHPRGRVGGTRAGIQADWPRIFACARDAGVAIELDGDPNRQDLDHALAAEALAAGCVFALNSDAHSAAELAYADTARAHARLAGIPASRIINSWPTERLLTWLDKRR